MSCATVAACAASALTAATARLLPPLTALPGALAAAFSMLAAVLRAAASLVCRALTSVWAEANWPWASSASALNWAASASRCFSCFCRPRLCWPSAFCASNSLFSEATRLLEAAMVSQVLRLK